MTSIQNRRRGRARTIAALVAIIALSSVLYLNTAHRMVYTIDEGYTNDSFQALEKFGEAGVAPSGAKYERATTYSYLAYHVSLLFSDHKVGLRCLSVIIALLGVALTYPFAKRVLGSSHWALTTTALVAVNWVYVAIGLTARNYGFSMLMCLGCYLLIIWALDGKGGRTETWLAVIGAALLATYNLFEGFQIFSLHLLILFFFTLMYKFGTKKNILRGLLVFLAIASVSSILIFVFAESTADFTLRTFGFELKNIYWEAFLFQGSTLLYANALGVLILCLSLLIGLFSRKTNGKVFVFSAFIVSVLLVQVLLFSTRRSYPRYFFDLLIPTIVVVMFWVRSLAKTHRAIGILLLAVVFVSSGVNDGRIIRQRLGYAFYQPSNFEKAVSLVPADAVIVTDIPNTIKMITGTRDVYALRDKPSDPELVNGDGEHLPGVTTTITPKITSDLEKRRFREEQLPGLILSPSGDQLYLYYDKTPKIMSVEHLKKISEGRKVYFILTHNAFENKNKKGDYALHQYIAASATSVSRETQANFTFDNRPFDLGIARPNLVTVLKLDSTVTP